MLSKSHGSKRSRHSVEPFFFIFGSSVLSPFDLLLQPQLSLSQRFIFLEQQLRSTFIGAEQGRKAFFETSKGEEIRISNAIL